MSSLVRHGVLPASILAMSATAWVAVSRLGESPWGQWAHGHGGHLNHTSAGGASSGLALAAAVVIGWVLMTVAMMLPTTLPLLTIFRRLTADRRDGMLLLLITISGYLMAWAVFGGLVSGAATLIQAGLGSSAWLAAHPRTPAAALFFIAGTFQFSDLKYRCLDKCRSPLSFIASRWRGGHERWQSFRIGVEHGAFCVGCCWALMLLMFVSAAASLTWMLALGAIMAIEKNVSWGRKLARPLGLALLAASSLMLMTG